MSQPQKRTMQRRKVMQAIGGLAAASAVGGSMTGTAFAAHDEDDYRGVRVNQVGYPVDGTKVAIATSQAMDVESVSTFEIVDAESGDVVEDGSLSETMDDEHGTDQTVRWADFSDFDEPGEYTVVVGDEESYPFEIAEAGELYAPVLRDVGRLYTLKRSNTRIEDPYTGLEIGPGHTQDEEAIIAEPVGDWLEDYEAGDTIDVSNGWYDAGDYGKYVVPAGITVAQLMLAYERNPDAFHAGQFYIDEVIDDEDLGEIPDVLVECKEELKFLEQMQRPNGALFYKVAGNESFPDMDVAPEDDDMERYVFGTSSVGTAHACGAFAMAARVYEDHKPEFAQEMLECAEAAWEWLEDNPDLVWEESENQDEGSGRYGRDDHDEPDRYWAAAELLRTTGDDSYDQWIQDTDLSWDGFDGEAEVPGDVEAPIDWNNPVGLGQYAYYKADGEYGHPGGTDPEEDGYATDGLTSPYWVGERYTGAGDTNDFWTTGTYDFFWGWSKSGLSRGVQGLWALDVYQENWYDGEEHWAYEEDHADLLTGPLDHVLGRSPTGYSLVTGHGEKSTQNPHDRIVQSQDMDDPIPGMLVGGPHTGSGIGEDDTADHLEISSAAEFDQGPLMAYADIHGSYSTNEWAINYTAPLFMMLAEVAGEIDETPEPGESDDDEDNGETIDVGEYEVRDTTDDGLYNDFDGDGETTHDDVTAFFENINDDAIENNSEAFDFADNGEIGFSDVIDLLRRV